MAVQKKQTVASGVKNDEKAKKIESNISASETTQKPVRKKAANQRKKKKVPELKVKDSNSAKQSQLEKKNGDDNIIKAHLETIGKHPLAKGMRVEKIAFCIFLSLPEAVRGDQRQFSKEWSISENSLSIWKTEPEVQKLRLVLMKRLLIDKTPAVIENLFNAASTKNAFWNVNTAAVKLWLQFVEEWEEASKVNLNATGWFTVNFWPWKSDFINPEDEQEQENPEE